jgi:hypothetical protein
VILSLASEIRVDGGSNYSAIPSNTPFFEKMRQAGFGGGPGDGGVLSWRRRGLGCESGRNGPCQEVVDRLLLIWLSYGACQLVSPGWF